MYINEVEHIVGLSKKSIRYYEENGLLSPTRNRENDYRIYTEKDIKKLKTIKFLRECNVPIKQLQKLEKGTISLTECMIDCIKKIEEEEKNYKKIKELCTEISKRSTSYENIEITPYFQEVNKLNKEGFTMRDVTSNKTKKITGAILSSLAFSLFFIFLVGMITYFQLTESTKMPWAIYTVLMVLFAFPLVSITYNLIKRIKEIIGGEEDEASKY